MVHHGYYLLPLVIGFLSLFTNPIQRPGRKRTGMRVNAYQHQSLHRFSSVAQRVGVACRIAVTIVGIERSKTFTGNRFHFRSGCTIVRFSTAVVNVVIAGNHVHLHASSFQLFQSACHILMAQQFSIFRQVASQQQQVGLVFSRLKLIHQIVKNPLAVV